LSGLTGLSEIDLICFAAAKGDTTHPAGGSPPSPFRAFVTVSLLLKHAQTIWGVTHRVPPPRSLQSNAAEPQPLLPAPRARTRQSDSASSCPPRRNCSHRTCNSTRGVGRPADDASDAAAASRDDARVLQRLCGSQYLPAPSSAPLARVRGPFSGSSRQSARRRPTALAPSAQRRAAGGGRGQKEG